MKDYWLLWTSVLYLELCTVLYCTVLYYTVLYYYYIIIHVHLCTSVQVHLVHCTLLVSMNSVHYLYGDSFMMILIV